MYSFNNRLLTLENAQEVVSDFVSKAKEGDKLVVEVYRKDKKGNFKLKTLKSHLKKIRNDDNVDPFSQISNTVLRVMPGKICPLGAVNNFPSFSINTFAPGASAT